MNERQLPILVGVAQHTNRSDDLDDALGPLEMMAKAAREAEEDAECKGLLGRLDSVGVANILSWSYGDAPGLLAEAVGAQPSDKCYTTVGATASQWLVSRAAERIVQGESRLALVAGAEAMRSVVKLGASGRPGWRSGRRGWRSGRRWTPPEAMAGDARAGSTEIEMRHGANAPLRIYPLFENALRAHKGRSIADHQRHLAALCARLAQVAKDNPFAWFRDGKTAEEIGTVTADNRMICFPYPKYMNAIMEVDQAAAVIMTSVGTAKELGIPREKWVYIWGCADAIDLWYLSERLNYYSSPAMALVGRRVLEMAGLSIDEIDWFDLYSCFPSAVEVARDMLGIAEDDPRPITLAGGLPYFGGPGNNYSLHAICAMVERLRSEPQRKALVSAMGWYFTKHAQGIYSGMPPEREWRRADSPQDQAELDAMRHPTLVEAADGAGTVETYTVVFGRSGEPNFAIVFGRLEDGGRFVANTEPDRELLRWMTQEEMVGRRAKVRHDAETGRNIVAIE
jgi:acetyl-CoA C-acetyltransferase